MARFSITAWVALLVLAMMTSVWSAPVDDLDASATGYDKHGRVQIKVYRGPSKGYGYHKFAPWGYWVKQPEDDHAKKHHYHDDDHH